ncbi:MAG: hypothetical protein AB7G68_10725 [Nitrospiraceae bacterium]
MILTVAIHSEGPTKPPTGSPVRVQVRDTGLADAPAVIVAEANGVVRTGQGDSLDTVDLTLGDVPRHATVWAHVDVDRDGRVSKGDYISTMSYPVPSGLEVRMRVAVRPV